ncbi:MAG: ATP-dependent Clp protease adapter ClpS [Microbacteriaceae bacterium]|nr:ATP-dependent Clp protease adapter ClpS [Microbacteriaceae bacterium]
MAQTASPDLDQELQQLLEHQRRFDSPWRTVVWNDPVNLMSYVTYVFRSYFGFSEERAHHLMLAVHQEGKAIVAQGTREEMERHVQAMHEYGLWATLDHTEA